MEEAALLANAAQTGAPDDIPVRVIMLAVSLLLVAGVAALVLQRLRFPYTIGLMVVGLACSWLGDWWALPLLPRVHLTENLVLYVFLPALVFDAALSLNLRALVRNIVPILLLAIPGVVFVTLLTGAVIHYLTPLAWGPAMLFGALISTTDPVACIAVFGELKAPEKLSMLVDGESLFNDATAIVMLGIVAGIIASGSPLDAATCRFAALRFLEVFFGGLGVGVGVGLAGALLIRLARGGSEFLGVLFSICAAYASFILAQGVLDLSGVMATVGAGLAISALTRNRDCAQSERMRGFWPVASFLGNSMIFLFLGLTERYLLDQAVVRSSAAMMLAAAVVVLAARALMVYGVTPIANLFPSREKISSGYKAVMAWSGLRGALPIGLAVGIRPEMLGLADAAAAEEQQRLIVLLTVAVVVFSLLFQGVSIKWLMRRVGIGLGGADAAEEVEMADVAQPVDAGEIPAPDTPEEDAEEMNEGEKLALAETAEENAAETMRMEPEENA